MKKTTPRAGLDPGVFRIAPESQSELSTEQLAAAAGLTPESVEALAMLGLIEPVTPGAAVFSADAAARLRRMVRLRAGLGISFYSAAIIADLVERLDRAEAELARRRS